MPKWTLGVIALVGLTAVAFAVASPAHVQKANAASEPVIRYVSATTTDAPPPTTWDTVLTPSKEPTPIDADEALAVARRSISDVYMLQASSIVIGKYRFTDGNTGESFVPHNVLVWIVSLNGMNGPVFTSYGQPHGVFRQENVVVDATTGSALEMYAAQYEKR